MTPRWKSAFVVVLMGVVFSVGLSAPAFAYGPNGPTDQTNPSSSAPGGSMTVSGSGFCPTCTITLTLHSTPVTLGTTTTDASGNFSTSVTIPNGTSLGDHTIIATDLNGDSASTGIVVTGTAVTTVAASSGLAFTGADIAALSAVGAIALALGGMLILTTRRRRRAA